MQKIVVTSAGFFFWKRRQVCYTRFYARIRRFCHSSRGITAVILATTPITLLKISFFNLVCNSASLVKTRQKLDSARYFTFSRAMTAYCRVLN